MDSLVMRNIEHSNQSDRFMGALTRKVIGGQAQITPMMAHIKSCIDQIEEENQLALMLQQQLLETTRQVPSAGAKGEALVAHSPTDTPSETSLYK